MHEYATLPNNICLTSHGTQVLCSGGESLTSAYHRRSTDDAFFAYESRTFAEKEYVEQMGSTTSIYT